MTPTVILAGAEKGGVGKTTAARVLLEYLGSRKIWARAVDTAYPRGDLRRFHPDRTALIDLSAGRTEDHIAGLLRDAQALVVDAGPGQFTACLDSLAGLQRKLVFAGRPFRLLVVHVCGGNAASLEEVETFAARVPRYDYVLVRNHPGNTSYFEWRSEAAESLRKALDGRREAAIPKLNELAFEYVDFHGSTFTDFARNRRSDGLPSDWSFVLRSYVRSWRDQVFTEFDRIGMAAFAKAETARMREA